MKKLAVIFTMVMTMFATVTMAQVPQSFAFQSTLTDTLGNPFANQTITVQFAIHSGSSTGTVVYSEEHVSVSTSASGYFSANVGEGTPISGTFAAINWGASSYWLELLVDTTGGSSVITMGASQLLSVPYALYAGTGSASATPSTYFYGVYLGTDWFGPGVQTVMFSSTVNRGTAYNNADGIFTVPTDGIYEISMGSPGSLIGDVMVNGVPYSANTFGGTIPVMFELVAGDMIYFDSDYYVSGTSILIKEVK